MTTEPGAEEIAGAAYRTAAETMAGGASAAEVENYLIQSGIKADDAKTIIRDVQAVTADALRKAGRAEMIRGGLWCVGGILVTAVTYQMASGGGTYVVAWGAIILGGLQFFRGLARMQSAGPSVPSSEPAAGPSDPSSEWTQDVEPPTMMSASPRAIDPTPAGTTWVWWLVGAVFAMLAGYIAYGISTGKLHW